MQFDQLTERFYAACIEGDSCRTLANEVVSALVEQFGLRHVLLFYRVPAAAEFSLLSQQGWFEEETAPLHSNHPLVTYHKTHRDFLQHSRVREKALVDALSQWEAQASLGLYRNGELVGLILFGPNHVLHFSSKEQEGIQRWSQILSLALDVFDQSQAQREFRSLVALKNKAASLAALSVNIHHEISNPLNIISLKCQWFDRKFLKAGSSGPAGFAAQAESVLNVALRQAQRISSITHRLSAFVRQNRGRLRIEGLVLSGVIDHCLELIGRTQFAADNIEVELEFENPFAEIYGDAVLLEQVILNLLMRSYRSIRKDGKIRLASYEPDAFTVVLEVNDTGAFLAAQAAESSADDSFPVTVEHSDRPLTGEIGEIELIRSNVETMRGHLEYRSPLTGGNQFILTLVKKWEKNRG